MAPTPQSRRIDVAREAPIRWSSDSITVENVLRYCQIEYYKVAKDRYGDARADILLRIHGNLYNPQHRAYNGHRDFGEISYATIARHAKDHPYDEASYLAALDSAWEILQSYFERNFIKSNPDD